MLTDAKLLQLVYDAATCYVPTEQLNEEQLERFDNITYRWCNCRRCKKSFKIRDKVLIPQNAAHANQISLEIRISRPVFKRHIDMAYPIFLLELIATTLHEIVHILFPEFNEDETINKTWEWLRKNEWVTDAENIQKTAKAQFEQEI